MCVCVCVCVCVCEVTDERQRGRVCEKKLMEKKRLHWYLVNSFGILILKTSHIGGSRKTACIMTELQLLQNLFKNAHVEVETFPEDALYFALFFFY